MKKVSAFLRKLALIIFIVFYINNTAFSLSIEVYFSPKGGCEKRIIELIDMAQESIDLAMYTFTNSKIAWALVKAYERGVKIRILLDGQEAQNKYSKGLFLKKRGIFVVYDRMPGLMHNKFCVIDNKIVITGSYNWTATAEEKNEENLIVIYDLNIANAYKKRFEYLIKINVPWWLRIFKGS
ncbi:MAG: phospholipase D family protein [Synergistetes bacterium]|nr:phospholipase D family protein [Synergistota bacterium]MDW8193133.1 phospholipase D family protein [Synergistota bacterium]